MIPTIEDYLKGKVYITQDGTEDVHDSLSNVVDACKDLIELHTKAALENASKTKVKTMKGNPILQRDGHDVNQILNAYPENLIK